MERIAFFPGSFDPFTKGHADIVERGLKLFDQVIIGIGTNPAKKRHFSLELMEKVIKGAFNDDARIRVVNYDDLTANVARDYGAKFLLRGLRNTTDFEYENTIAQVNRQIVEGLETVFLITSPSLAPISSTIVRELHSYGVDVSDYLPYPLESLTSD
ncbi:pantetheine-phosphate adenylyltransferase [Jiulongibacter sediminis]|uniref:Phosphopantetheine adenylyltransferase n=1 Tax=Jiulongibacter sediminis TaxID=1605367 RepID=A0A0P7BZ62_9BACT|nr:pantetheine-phosphate adenylyltransferase [Jiulongibacter sediminis]KPM47482.1 phosphopantetheine adenylyltransferase [Jiulongibacter sediminis]TBX23275.1 phosphopantetheine adenylyltransferase [Jiulongibacter sediminis]